MQNCVFGGGDPLPGDIFFPGKYWAGQCCVWGVDRRAGQTGRVEAVRSHPGKKPASLLASAAATAMAHTSVRCFLTSTSLNSSAYRGTAVMTSPRLGPGILGMSLSLLISKMGTCFVESL